MSYPGIKAASGIVSQLGSERLKGSGANNLEREKQRLRKATNEFESLFMYEMLKTMRKTIPKNASSENAPFSNDLGKDTFMQMFDMELARKMSSGDAGSISAILYNSLEKVIEEQYRSNQPGVKIESLSQKSQKPIELNRHRMSIPLLRSQVISVDHKRKESLPSGRSLKGHTDDRILSQFGRYIDKAARQTSLDSALIYAVIKAESNGNPHAVSSAGAKGLMQLADSTVRDYRVTRVFDPDENILAGSTYLKHLLDRFGDLRLALAAYNAGPQNVERYNGVPPFRETEAYIDKVIDIFTSLKRTPPVREAKVPVTNVR